MFVCLVGNVMFMVYFIQQENISLLTYLKILHNVCGLFATRNCWISC